MRHVTLAIGALVVFGLGAAGWLVVSSTPGPGSMELALKGIQDRPQDPSAWLALGDAQADVGSSAAAEHAYRTAIHLADAVQNSDGRARARLGFLLYEQGSDREAFRWLSEARQRGANVVLLDETLALLAEALNDGDRPVPKAPSPPQRPTASRLDAGIRGTGPAAVTTPDAGVAGLDASTAPDEVSPFGPADEASEGPSACEVPLIRRPNGGLVAQVELNGVVVDLLLDTGATITVLNRTIADQVGVSFSPGVLTAQTANGQTTMRLAVVDQVVLGNRILEGARVAVCEECIQNIADGLLGVDLQAAFDVQVDVVARKLWFAGCN